MLNTLGKNAEAEEVLKQNESSSEKNLLLLARAQKAQGKPEAVETYSTYLEKKNEAAVRLEYAESLEQAEFYARALEQYKLLSESAEADKKALLSFRSARVLLKADPSAEEGITFLEEALKGGFDSAEEIDALLAESSIPEAKKKELETYRQSSAQVE
jgi:hypothetical protein